MKEKIALPNTFKTPSEIEKTTPELLQKRYLVEIVEITKKSLESKVSLKEMWKWQLSDDHWMLLATQFPQLSLTATKTAQERHQVLDNQDDTTRSKIDAFSRAAIVDSHPEWIENALMSATPKLMTLNIPLNGGVIFIKGNIDRKALMTLLDEAPLNETPTNNLKNFTEDHAHFYQIKVIDRSAGPEIMTYAEANQANVLKPLADAQMKNYYEKIRTQKAALYKNDDQSWKNYEEVSDSVLGEYFKDFTDQLSDDYVKSMAPKDDNKNLSLSRAASLRFFQHAMNSESLEEKSPTEDHQTPSENSTQNKLSSRKPLEAQWRFISRPFEINKSSKNPVIDKNDALALKEGEWSKIYTPTNGDLYFFQVTKKINGTQDKILENQVRTMYMTLGNEAQRKLGNRLISLMVAKGSLSLDYLVKQPKEKEERGE